MPKATSPVVPGLEAYEIVYGATQPEYIPLPTLRGKGPTYTVYSRWVLSDEEKLAILLGADVYIMQITAGNRYQPTTMLVSRADANEDSKDEVLKALGLDEELNERLKNML